MNQINIFKTEKEKLRLAVIEHDYEPPSLTIVDATDGDVGNQIYIKKKIEDIPSYFDCDGLTKNALVLPATVRGIIDYLDDCSFDYAGKTAVVLGRSNIVGKPMAKALLDRDMTHSKTNYGDKEYNADLVICATGQPQSIHREQCESAIVVDVGISRLNGKIVGDFVEDENNIVREAWSTPVPGGVGLLTRLGLMKNCLDLKVL
jgi:methylenetetrahydrofolate dehydrogenase (NADP+)/methenyltetrahydrofolate cyclohydrolase